VDNPKRLYVIEDFECEQYWPIGFRYLPTQRSPSDRDSTEEETIPTSSLDRPKTRTARTKKKLQNKIQQELKREAKLLRFKNDRSAIANTTLENKDKKGGEDDGKKKDELRKKKEEVKKRVTQEREQEREKKREQEKKGQKYKDGIKQRRKTVSQFTHEMVNFVEKTNEDQMANKKRKIGQGSSILNNVVSRHQQSLKSTTTTNAKKTEKPLNAKQYQQLKKELARKRQEKQGMGLALDPVSHAALAGRRQNRDTVRARSRVPVPRPVIGKLSFGGSLSLRKKDLKRVATKRAPNTRQLFSRKRTKTG